MFIVPVLTRRKERMMIFNYVRVSTALQNTDRQLFDVSCDREYVDRLSGKDINRPQLQAMIDNIRDGDVINCHSMDRLARNVRDLLDLIERITSKGGKIRFFKENLVFSNTQKGDAFQKLMLVMLGAISEFERNLILERQREGIAVAKLKGKYKGGKNKLIVEQVQELRNLISTKSLSVSKAAVKFGISRQSVYNYLRDNDKICHS